MFRLVLPKVSVSRNQKQSNHCISLLEGLSLSQLSKGHKGLLVTPNSTTHQEHIESLCKQDRDWWPTLRPKI